MEHLPPGGWYDVARTGDFDRIDTNTRWIIGISLTYGIGILGALVTFMVASLN